MPRNIVPRSAPVIPNSKLLREKIGMVADAAALNQLSNTQHPPSNDDDLRTLMRPIIQNVGEKIADAMNAGQNVKESDVDAILKKYLDRKLLLSVADEDKAANPTANNVSEVISVATSIADMHKEAAHSALEQAQYYRDERDLAKQEVDEVAASVAEQKEKESSSMMSLVLGFMEKQTASQTELYQVRLESSQQLAEQRISEILNDNKRTVEDLKSMVNSVMTNKNNEIERIRAEQAAEIARIHAENEQQMKFLSMITEMKAANDKLQAQLQQPIDPNDPVRKYQLGMTDLELEKQRDNLFLSRKREASTENLIDTVSNTVKEVPKTIMSLAEMYFKMSQNRASSIPNKAPNLANPSGFPPMASSPPAGNGTGTPNNGPGMANPLNTPPFTMDGNSMPPAALGPGNPPDSIQFTGMADPSFLTPPIEEAVSPRIPTIPPTTPINRQKKAGESFARTKFMNGELVLVDEFGNKVRSSENAPSSPNFSNVREFPSGHSVS